jgi:AcrR family transcriptional regulator
LERIFDQTYVLPFKNNIMDLTKDAKDRIVQASVQLFSRKGYSAVGVRDIAATAECNIAMISYYFGGKIGILKNIIEEYFHDLDTLTNNVLENCTSADECLRNYIKAMIRQMQQKPELCRVAIIEMPFDLSEITDFKLTLMHKHMLTIKEKFHKNMPSGDNPAEHVIIGPAFFSLIYSNFLFGEIARMGTKVVFNEKFYDYYAEVITTMFLRGVIGLADMNRGKRGEDVPPMSHPSGFPGGHPAGHPMGHPGGHPGSMVGHPNAKLREDGQPYKTTDNE